MSVEALLRPRSVALVGANEKASFGGHAARNLISCKDRLEVYFVNPSRDELYGLKCYKSLTDIPVPVDCVIIAIPKHGVSAVLEQAGELGVKAAIVYASGYTEEHTEEGDRLDGELRRIAARYDMDIMGPNCMGVINNVDRINLMGLGVADAIDNREPKVAIISHSGALSSMITRRGAYPVAFQVSVGNGTVTAMEDYIDFLIDEDEVKVIALYMEGVIKPEVFLKALKKAAIKRKPIVVLKTGRGEIASAAVASHTGSLAGAYATFEAVFKKYGVIAVDNLEELICTSYMLATLNGSYPKVPSAVGFCLSGGANALMAEAGEKAGVCFPKFSEETKVRLRSFIPGFSTPANPLDATTDLFYKSENIIEIIKVFNDVEDIGVIVTGQDISREPAPTSDIFVNALIDAKHRHGVTKPIIFAGLTEQDRNPEQRARLEAAGIPVLGSVVPSMQSVKYLLDFIAYRPEDHDLRIPELAGEFTETQALTEWLSRQELSGAGIPVPSGALVTSAEEISLVENLKMPLVAKISSPDILHKSDVGGVRLNINSPAEALEAFEDIMERCAANRPDAKLEGVLFVEMAQAGTEFIVGVNTDPQLGPIVLAGMGGIFVEVFKDAQLCPAPLSRQEAMDMLEGLKAHKILRGYRGEPAKDIDALADTLVSVSEYAYQNSRSLKELDLNPVFVYDEGEGVLAVDALVIKA